MRYPSQTGDWQLGDTDLEEYLDRLPGPTTGPSPRGVEEAEPETYNSHLWCVAL